MTVLLVESHALVRAGLRALLSSADGLAVVAEASTLIEAAESARRHRPDVVLVDGRELGSPDGEDLAPVREAAPDACVVVLADDALARVGPPPHAHGCLAPTASVQELCATVASLLGSRCANCRFRTACPVPRLAVALSRRERQVAVRVAEGMQSKHIAAALGIRVRTVNTYRESLARKIGASSAAVLTRFVLETGLSATAAEGSPSK